MTDDLRIGTVVLTWNSAATITACLQSLRGEVRPGDVVLVADNGSTDATVAIVRREHPWVEVQEHGENLGFAGGNARSMAGLAARGLEFLFVLNPDTVVRAGALAALRAFAAARPAAAALQPVLLSTATASRPTIDSLGLRARRSFGGEDIGHGEAWSDALAPAPREILGPCGAAALYRTAALARGAFDPDLFLLAEDLELALRLRAAGHEAWLVPTAIVEHRRGISGAQRDPAAARRRKHWLQRNTVAVALCYWPLRWLLLFAPLLVWRSLQALWCGRANRGHATLPLWRRSLRRRAAQRRGMRGYGVDRWIAGT